jgi:hypothetical protein
MKSFIIYAFHQILLSFIGLKRMRWARHVAHMSNMRIARKIVIRNPEWKSRRLVFRSVMYYSETKVLLTLVFVPDMSSSYKLPPPAYCLGVTIFIVHILPHFRDAIYYCIHVMLQQREMSKVTDVFLFRLD